MTSDPMTNYSGAEKLSLRHDPVNACLENYQSPGAHWLPPRSHRSVTKVVEARYQESSRNSGGDKAS